MRWNTILVPHDFSSSADHAAEVAREEALQHRARLLVLHVVELPHYLPPDVVIVPTPTAAPVNARMFATSAAELQLRELVASLAAPDEDAPDAAAGRVVPDAVGGTGRMPTPMRAALDVTGHLRTGDPGDEIIRFAAEHDVDLIVMGTHGRRGVRAMIAGSVAERVVRTAEVPVLTIRYRE